MKLPLDGISVLELGRVFAAPYCGMMLGDMGANVIKVERPGYGDESRTFPPFVNGESSYFLSLNRNKRSITLNLKHDAAKKILYTLIKTSDVFLHNTLPGTIERLGFSYDKVSEVNSRIVYCCISGYGEGSPFQDNPSQDIVAQSLSGIMSLTGYPEGEPLRVGFPITDLCAGMIAAYSIVTALFQRQKTGIGQKVSTSLLEAALAITSTTSTGYFISEEIPQRLGNAHASIAPYNVYRVLDGYISIAITNDSMWERFCKALGDENLAKIERFKTNARRLENREELETLITKNLSHLTKKYIARNMRDFNVCCGEVNEIQQVFECREVQALNMQIHSQHPTMGDVKFVAPPSSIRNASEVYRLSAPKLGEHTEEILRSLDYSTHQITHFRELGVL